MSPTPTPTPEHEKVPPLAELPWYRRLNLLNTTLLIFVLAVIFSGSQIEGNERDLDILKNLGRFLSDFFPPDLSVLKSTGSALIETVEIAILATFFAIIISLIIALGCRPDNWTDMASL
jgi:phosphonate transport system permease protein